MSLTVLDPGIQSLVVDFGRPTTRSLGVPVGGAADRCALALGNALVGNSPDLPALEIAMSGPVLQSDAYIGAVVFGAPFDLATDRQSLQIGKTFSLTPGEVLTIRGTPRGVRAYLCVCDGFRVPEILHSHSTLAPIRSGDRLDCGSRTVPARFLDPSAPYFLPELRHHVRVLPGRQSDWFNMDHFFSQDFQVTAASNRMGLRLSGPSLSRTGGEIVSEPVCPGTVQVANDGQCIVLGIDGQTIGGYPKIAQIIQADLDSLGQLAPGQIIRFQPITLAEAEDLSARQIAELNAWLTRIRTATSA